MGAFRPSPPDCAPPLCELIERLSTSTCLIDLPRDTDLLMHERLVKRRYAVQRWSECLRQPKSRLLAIAAKWPHSFELALQCLMPYRRY
jgi:hypothetical protein